MNPLQHATTAAIPEPRPAPLVDPVAAFLGRPLHAHSQPPRITHSRPNASPVAALEAHAERYEWATVLDRTATLLAADVDGSLPPDDVLHIQTFRAVALVQTRQEKPAADLLQSLGDLSEQNPRYCYESFPHHYHHQVGSFVPFHLRLLALDVRARAGDSTAIHDAYRLKATLPEADERHLPICSVLASLHLRHGWHDTAVDIIREVTTRAPGPATGFILLRAFLHIGDFEAAENQLQRVAAMHGVREDVLLAHRGMVHAAFGRHQEAVDSFDHAIAKGGDVWVYASNNAAICLLHLGRVTEAVERLEAALRRQPDMALDEALVSNLAILYDFAYVDDAVEKKIVLRKLAERSGRQGFDLESIPM